MRTLLCSLLFIATSTATTPAPRPQWVFVPGAQDLIQAGMWSCVPGLTVGAGSLTIAATTEYNTISNTTGPVLRPQGDFSVLASLSAPSSTGTFLTLVGTLNTSGPFWQGLKRLDVGVDNNSILANYWTGASANPTSHTFSLPHSATDTIALEVARIGAQITVFVNGSEVGSFPDPGLFASGVVYLGFNVAPQNTLTVQALAAAMPAGGGTKLFAAYLQVAKRTGSALRDIADPTGFLIGGAVNPDHFSDSAYAQAVGREFNLMVPENVMKFAETEPGPHQYSF